VIICEKVIIVNLISEICAHIFDVMFRRVNLMIIKLLMMKLHAQDIYTCIPCVLLKIDEEWYCCCRLLMNSWLIVVGVVMRCCC